MRATNRTPRGIIVLLVVWLSLGVSGLAQRSVADQEVVVLNLKLRIDCFSSNT